MLSDLIKDLDPVICSVAHDDVAKVVDGNAEGKVKLSVSSAIRSKRQNMSEMIVKDLNPVIKRIANDNLVLVVDGDASWTIKLAVCASK